MIEDDCVDNGIPLPNVTSKILAGDGDRTNDEDLIKSWDAEFVIIKVDRSGYALRSYFEREQITIGSFHELNHENLSRRSDHDSSHVVIMELTEKMEEKVMVIMGSKQASEETIDMGALEMIGGDVSSTRKRKFEISMQSRKKRKKGKKKAVNVRRSEDGVNDPSKNDTHMTPSRNTSSVSSGHDLLSTRGSHQNEEWYSDLLDCCADQPSL